MDIINLQQYADALRSTGYKNIESAISEIIDNSIEAGAKDILILLNETLDGRTGRKRITDIAFLDNGCGMSKELLEGSIAIGCGTRTARNGIGRFGVGLPQASMHVAPRLEVFSWEEYGQRQKVYLDVDEMKSGKQAEIFDAIYEEIPDEFNFLDYNTGIKKEFKKSGTMVLWKNCDNVTPSKIITLSKRLMFELGKRFRYFLNNGEVSIQIIDISNSANPMVVKPYDPMFLMEKGVLAIEGEFEKITDETDLIAEPIFEPFTGENNEYDKGVVEVPIKYIDKKTNEIKEEKVVVKLSVVKEKFYSVSQIPKNPGGTAIGKEVRKAEGISIIRAKREVDFGRFDFYKAINTPEHRWWGCEIEFGTDLDEVFGVSNNKQHVEIIKVGEENADYSEEEIKTIWEQLSIVEELIKKMKKRNSRLRENARTDDGHEVTPVEEVVNRVNPSENTVKKDNKSNDLEMIKGRDITDERKLGILNNGFGLIEVEDTDESRFFDIVCNDEVCLGRINKNSSFNKNFLESINDEALKNCFRLMLSALAKTKEDFTNREDRNIIDDFIEEWNIKIDKYIKDYMER